MDFLTKCPNLWRIGSHDFFCLPKAEQENRMLHRQRPQQMKYAQLGAVISGVWIPAG